MSANVDEGAKKLGERLLTEVEVEDLSSVLKALREINLRKKESEDNQISPQNSVFGIPELDALLPGSIPPILELVSPPPVQHPAGAGKTSLLYLIIAHAVLPASFSLNVLTGCHEAAVVLFDPLHHFSIPRFAEVLLNVLKSKLQGAGTNMNKASIPATKSLIKECLHHIHIFQPQSWASLLATLRSLPDYLFDKDRHASMHRRVHSIILEDVDVFVASIRNTSHPSSRNANPIATASTHLTTALHKLSTLFSSAAILTSSSTSPMVFRPPLPTAWNQGAQVVRLAVRRAEVLKFAPAISVEEAETERQQRWEVVSRARLECWKVGAGARDGEGFVLKVAREGVIVEREEEK